MSQQLQTLREQLQPLESMLRNAEKRLSDTRAKAKDPGGPNLDYTISQLEDRVKELKAEIAPLRIQEKEVEDRQNEREEEKLAVERRRVEAAEAAVEQAKAEERAFWFRRFHTSLALAHGAGFAAVASKLFDSTVTPDVAAGAWHPMACFAIGMVVAGLIPVALFRESQRVAWGLAISSATLFLMALTLSLAAVWTYAGLVWPWAT